jgi:tetratricopeptide (TPR) repeat protein
MNRLAIDMLCNLAYIYLDYKKPKRAIDYLQIAEAINPHEMQIKRLQATAYLDAKLPAKAINIIEEMDKSKLSNQDYITTLLLKSLCYNAMGMKNEAHETFKDYVAKRNRLADDEAAEIKDIQKTSLMMHVSAAAPRFMPTIPIMPFANNTIEKSSHTDTPPASNKQVSTEVVKLKPNQNIPQSNIDAMRQRMRQAMR